MFGQAAADRPPVPGRDRHKVVQRLVVHLAEPGGHRFDRLAPPVQHQPAQVALATGTLVLARQRLEHSAANPSRRPPMAANSAGVIPPNSSPPGRPEGGSTHTPPARRKPDRALLGPVSKVGVSREMLRAWDEET